MKKTNRASGKKRKRCRKRRKGLIRQDKLSILEYCMVRLQWQCRRVAGRLSTDMRRGSINYKDKVKEVISDTNLHVWRAIQKYRFKPYKQVLMLAYRSGQNALTSMLRTPVRSLRKGANQKQVFDSEAIISLTSNQQLQSIATIILLDTLVFTAIKLVGEKQAPYLIKAALHDWMPRNMNNEKQKILRNLDCDRPRQVRRLLNKLVAETKQQMTGSGGEPSVATMKTFGLWRQRDLTVVH